MKKVSLLLLRAACLLFLLLGISALLSSCTEEGQRLTVYSDDYPGLTALYQGDMEVKQIQEWHHPDYRYRNHACHLSMKDGNLIVSDTLPDETFRIYQGKNGYFFGVSMHTYDGWVRYSPYRDPNATDQQVVVTNDHCQGFIEIDDENAFLMTYNYFADSQEERETAGTLYRLTYAGDGDVAWRWEVVVSFPDRPIVGGYDKETDALYLTVSDRNGITRLLSVTTEGTVTPIMETEWLSYMPPLSIVKRGQSILCGTQAGIYEYRLETAEEVWYPMDYEAYYSS